MAILLVLLALLGLGGFALLPGHSDESGSGPAAPQRPPAVELATDGGVQRGVQGSYCVTDAEAGEGVCADTAGPPAPEALSTVGPGERVVLRLAGADDADGTATIRRLGCEDRVAGVELAGPETEWAVDLPEGAYQLDVFATFEAGSAKGDTSAVLGLLVDAAAGAEIVPARPAHRACP